MESKKLKRKGGSEETERVLGSGEAGDSVL